MHDAVVSRRRELGIRLTLGAAPTTLRMMVLRQGLGLATLGLSAGLAVSLALSTVLARLVYGIRSTDPLTLLGVSLLAMAMAVAAAASALPGILVTRVAPSETLSAE